MNVDAGGFESDREVASGRTARRLDREVEPEPPKRTWRWAVVPRRQAAGRPGKDWGGYRGHRQPDSCTPGLCTASRRARRRERCERGGAGASFVAQESSWLVASLPAGSTCKRAPALAQPGRRVPRSATTSGRGGDSAAISRPEPPADRSRLDGSYGCNLSSASFRRPRLAGPSSLARQVTSGLERSSRPEPDSLPDSPEAAKQRAEVRECEESVGISSNRRPRTWRQRQPTL